MSRELAVGNLRRALRGLLIAVDRLDPLREGELAEACAATEVDVDEVRTEIMVSAVTVEHMLFVLEERYGRRPKEVKS